MECRSLSDVCERLENLRAIYRIHHSNRQCRRNRSRDEMQGRRIEALAGPGSTTRTSVICRPAGRAGNRWPTAR